MENPKNLFSEISVGSYIFPNRIAMAPMTRNRANAEGVPTAMMETYYSQRASAGLIITEASQVSPQGVGYPSTPGIYSEAQVEGWKPIVESVHKKNGHIFLQLWHTGRISHPDFHRGDLPVAPSAITPKGESATLEGMKPFVTPRTLKTEEISEIVAQFQTATANAFKAGFDGVEIHGANGYLVDQFLRDGTNKREDIYGGSIENQARFALEILNAVISVCGSKKVAIRISPSGTFNDMSDSDPTGIFGYLTTQLNALDLAYLHVVDALEGDIRHGAKVVPLDIFRSLYNGVLMTNGEYDKQRGNATISDGKADIISFGQLFLANLDLPARLQKNAPLNTPDPNTFYGGNETGYTDYHDIDYTKKIDSESC